MAIAMICHDLCIFLRNRFFVRKLSAYLASTPRGKFVDRLAEMELPEEQETGETRRSHFPNLTPPRHRHDLTRSCPHLYGFE